MCALAAEGARRGLPAPECSAGSIQPASGFSTVTCGARNHAAADGLICSSCESAGVTDDLRCSRRSSSAPCGEGLRHTSLINYALYQTGWFACVLGASWRRPGVGLSIALVLIGAHVVLSPKRNVEVGLVLFATVVGAAVEIFQIAAGTYHFTSGTVDGVWPPPWLLVMWAQFATTFRFGLRRVIAQPLPAALFGAAGGPVAFIAGQRLGAVTLLPPVTHGLLRLSVTWGIALVVFSVVVRRVSVDGHWPRYHTSRSR